MWKKSRAKPSKKSLSSAWTHHWLVCIGAICSVSLFFKRFILRRQLRNPHFFQKCFADFVLILAKMTTLLREMRIAQLSQLSFYKWTDCRWWLQNKNVYRNIFRWNRATFLIHFPVQKQTWGKKKEILYFSKMFLKKSRFSTHFRPSIWILSIH